MGSKLIASSVILQSKVNFGTSGARGLVTQFTADVCAAFTLAFITEAQKKYSFDTVAIAIDNRPSSLNMAKSCAALIEQIGLNVVYYGVIPTPALAFAAQEKSIPAIMVTGSHIPFDRNGLKFYNLDGEITKEDEIKIIASLAEYNSISALSNLVTDHYAESLYIERYTSLFSSDWLVGKKIGIYEHSSAGRDLYHKIFERLGASVTSLGRSDIFIPIDTEAVSEDDTLKALNWAQKYNLDLIFSTDGDGDRPLVSDENGQWLKGDVLGVISAEVLGVEALAVPVNCNSSVELSNNFKFVKRTKIGSPYVISEFDHLLKNFKAVAGFEANGGFLLSSDIKINGNIIKRLPTRDAMLPVIALILSSSRVSISSHVEDVSKRYTFSDRVQDYPLEKSKELLIKAIADPSKLISNIGFKNNAITDVNTIDGLRITFNDDKVIHIRPSGNAPELRCYAEAATLNTSKSIVERFINFISQD